MRCEEWRMEISSWLDNELDDPAQALLHGHLSTCVECRRFFADVRRVSATLEPARNAFQEIGNGSDIPLIKRRISVPFAGIMLGMVVACLLTIMAGIVLARAEQPGGMTAGYRGMTADPQRSRLEWEIRP